MTDQTNPAETMAEELPVPHTVEEALLNRTKAMMYWHERALAAETDFARTLRERDAAREALRALVDDLDLRAELHAKLHNEDEVTVPVSDGILQRARAVLDGKP